MRGHSLLSFLFLAPMPSPPRSGGIDAPSRCGSKANASRVATITMARSRPQSNSDTLQWPAVLHAVPPCDPRCHALFLGFGRIGCRSFAVRPRSLANVTRNCPLQYTAIAPGREDDGGYFTPELHLLE